MNVLLPLIASAISITSSTPTDPAQAVERWGDALYTCSSGENHDGEKVSEADMKTACIALGVITTRLTDANYCYDASTHIWEQCK